MSHLSVVICSYNRLDMLSELIGRLESQTQPVEIIVMDDGTPEAIEAMRAHHLAILNTRLHTSYQRVERYNSGVARVRTKYVALLDDDCLPLSEHWALEHIELLGERPVARGCFLDDDGEFRHAPWFSTTNLSMHTDLAQRLGPFDMTYNGRYGYEDVDLEKTLEREKIEVHRGGPVSAVRHRGKPFSGDRIATQANEAYYRKKWGL